MVATMITLEETALRLLPASFPAPEREYRFHAKRKWRFDLAWPGLRIAVEIEGGTWSGGRHTRPQGFAADCEKYNAAAVLGWRVLRYTGAQIRKGEHARDLLEIIILAPVTAEPVLH